MTASFAIKSLLLATRPRLATQPKRFFQCSIIYMDKYLEKTDRESKKRIELRSFDYFENAQEKNRQTFINAIELFNKQDLRKRGSVEFVYAALKQMKEFGVHRDIEVYRKLVDIFPKGKYIPENKMQAIFYHYPKQQDCVTDVLQQMGSYKVMPDSDFGKMVENIFGMHSKPYKSVMRMWYWLPKLNNLSPWPLPWDLPNSHLETAKLAIQQITSVDRLTEINVYDCNEIQESTDKTWIVSGQSPIQKDMITKLPKDKALYVEGAFRVWLRESQVNYFILRGDPVPRPPPPKQNIDDCSSIKNWAMGEFSPDDCVYIPNTHEQEDGTILGCCATGTSSKDSLLSWIRFLQKENPGLEDIPILFMLTSPLGKIIPIVDEETEIGQF